MPPELRGGEFRPFRRGSGADDGGSGLGLAVASRLAQAMQGALEVEANAPRGTRFILRLPLAEEQ
jgi:signal transduction histidine kinase